MVSKIYSAALCGVDGFEVTVECSSWDRLPHFDLVGMGDTAVKEAKERVRSAIENSGIPFPAMDMMVNLAPADRRKEGAAFDVAIAVSILHACRLIPKTDMEHCAFAGELSLSGEVRAVDGILCMTLAAKAAGRRIMFVPAANAPEAAVVSDMTVYGIAHLSELIAYLKNERELTPTGFDRASFDKASAVPTMDFADVCGQSAAKRALEIAAAGGHNVLLIGPPGAGKSLLARCLPSILPDLTFDEAIECTKIHSVAGELRGDGNTPTTLLTHRPFRSPHHTVSAVAMVGGGTYPKPGEVSLAHNGVLFLDEFPEFSTSMLDALRQPVEDGFVSITRAAARVRYPSSFMMVCAMNPCKCGNFGSQTRPCTCTPTEARKYLNRISGPLLDRIDIQLEIAPVSFDQLHTGQKAEPSAAVRERVNKARAFAAARYAAAGYNIRSNADLDAAAVRACCEMDEEALAILNAAFEKLGLSARGHDRLIKVARTIADLAGSDIIKKPHIAEAIMYRSLDRPYWKR